MKLKTLAVAGALAFAFAATPAAAKTFRYAFQGDLNSLDPYTLNETFTLGVLGNVYGGPHQARQGPQDHPRPRRALGDRRSAAGGASTCARASSSTTARTSPPTTCVFSVDRMRSPASQIKTRAPADIKAVKVDDYTVDFVLTSPNPILHAEWDTWYIFSKKWAEANGATQPQAASATSLNPFALKANGTGPFIIVSHEPGVKTVFKPNPNWWGKPEHNLDEVIFQTIKSRRDARRRAAVGRHRHDGPGAACRTSSASRPAPTPRC